MKQNYSNEIDVLLTFNKKFVDQKNCLAHYACKQTAILTSLFIVRILKRYIGYKNV